MELQNRLNDLVQLQEEIESLENKSVYELNLEDLEFISYLINYNHIEETDLAFINKSRSLCSPQESLIVKCYDFIERKGVVYVKKIVKKQIFNIKLKLFKCEDDKGF